MSSSKKSLKLLTQKINFNKLYDRLEIDLMSNGSDVSEAINYYELEHEIREAAEESVCKHLEKILTMEEIRLTLRTLGKISGLKKNPPPNLLAEMEKILKKKYDL